MLSQHYSYATITSVFFLSLNKTSSAKFPLFPRKMKEKYVPLGLESYVKKSEHHTRCFLIFKIKKLRPRLVYQGPPSKPGQQ